MIKARLKLMPLLCCLLLALTSLNVHANSDKASLDIVDSTEEYVEVQKEVMKTLYRQESYQDTCYKREEYVEKVCGNETKYRRECSPVPGRQHCYNYNDRQCSTNYETQCRTTYDRQCSTNYQRECSTSYERQCRTVPGEVQCTTAPNGDKVCQKIPPRELCESVPREQCRDVPRQECRDVPKQECSQVPREQCYDVPKNKCEWIPATEECRDIPYQENVCRNVTKYKDIPYKCTKQRQIPYEVLDQLVIGKVNFKASKSANSDLAYRANFSINKNKELEIAVTNAKATKATILRATKTQKVSVNGDVKTIEAQYSVKEEQPALNSLLNGVKVSWVSLTRQKITIAINKEIDASKLYIDLEILKGQKTYFDKTLRGQDFSISKRGGLTYLSLNLIENGGDELDGVLNKKFNVNLRLVHNYEISNPENVIFQNVSGKLQSEVKFATIVKRE